MMNEKKEKERIFIFILCPPYHGSTILVNLLNTSENVSSFINVEGAKNGECHWLLRNKKKKIYKDKHIYDDDFHNNRFNPEYDLDLNKIKLLFDNYLDPNKQIFVDKCPPTICRAKMYEEFFSKFGKVYFIISIRNPYNIKGKSAGHWVRVANWQKNNIENLKNENIIVTSYEELCLDIDNIINRIKTVVPELNDIQNNFNGNHNTKITSNKINSDILLRLIDVEKKNYILKNNLELLKYFNYQFIN